MLDFTMHFIVYEDANHQSSYCYLYNHRSIKPCEGHYFHKRLNFPRTQRCAKQHCEPGKDTARSRQLTGLSAAHTWFILLTWGSCSALVTVVVCDKGEHSRVGRFICNN
ncbi:hypothetical protein PoB_003151000 [Plakobranchus ocellatus]|uniref:Uncharacterized protein n=1 Tax=Plakobranchus ocellatus TaxID=259542 RepID=A0AAV4A9Z2_9GAST|nr:hypothetical protein PoB_003151000 [Plakobranchus ocellatus]